jgi:phage minor structural protein
VLEAGTYTVSFFYKTSVARVISISLVPYGESAEGVEPYGTGPVNAQGSDEWQRLSCTFTLSEQRNLNPRIENRTTESTKLYVSAPQLEVGSETTLFEGYHSTWYVDDNGELTHTDFPAVPDKAFQAPLPKSIWRTNAEYNHGYPYNELMPNVEYTPPPSPVKQHEYITIHDLTTLKNGFNNHGLAILTPTRCTITEELNGAYALSIEHPIDDVGRWKFIRESNIIKAMGQLFTIRTVKQSWVGSKGKITATADHIFYQLNDWWIRRGAHIIGSTVMQLMQSAVAFTDKHLGEADISYTFTFFSDINVDFYTGYEKWANTEQGMTPNEFILGSNGLIATFGGELYRDNFSFSVCQRKQYTKDNAFELRRKKNMQAITRTIDISTICTWFTGYDNYGNEVSVSYALTGIIGRLLPHNVVREKKFQYDFDSSLSPADSAMRQLSQDVLNYHASNCQPLVCYEVKVRELKNDPEYKEFTNFSEFKVGNTGVVYDEELNEKVTLKITKTVTNAITGEVEEVTFGQKRSFVTTGQQAITILDLEQTVQSKFFKVRDADGAFVLDADGAEIIEEVE